jgi:hypothetical protein
MEHSVPEPAVCQKLARLIGGGEHLTYAGVATDTVVSLNSREGEDPNPTQSTEQVADEPWLAGGHHISI